MRKSVRSGRPQPRRGFNVEAYLDSTGPARKALKYQREMSSSRKADPDGGNKINSSLLSIVLHD